MADFTNPFTKIKNAYLELFNDSNSIEIKKSFARNIVDIIVSNVYFERSDVIELYHATNNDIKEHKTRNKPYGTSFREKLTFLCDHNLIAENLKSEYLFMNTEAGRHSIAHTKFKKGEERLLHIMKVFTNEILESLLDKFEDSKDYLIPIEIVSKNNKDFHKRVIHRIDTFWDKKQGEVWYIKYRTIFSFVVIILSSILLPIISIPLILFQIYITKNNVFDSRLKKLRNGFLYAFLLISFSVIGRNLYLNKTNDNLRGVFSKTPFDEIKGSIGASYLEDTIVKKQLDLTKLKKNEFEEIVIEHRYRNDGDADLLSPKASLEIIENREFILFEGTLKSDRAKLIDTTHIKIKKPYLIEFIEGVVYNPYGSDCKGYGYRKILFEDYFKKHKGINGISNYNDVKTFNDIYSRGIDIHHKIDNYQNGYCSRGTITSIFKITKL